MSTVYISHVAKDAEIARQIAEALEAARYPTCAVSPAEPGAAGIERAATTIERCRVVVVLISPSSLGSAEMTAEIVRAHEHGKEFLPVLLSLSHAEFVDLEPVWRTAIGAASSVVVPPDGVRAILPRIVEGVAALTAPVPRPPLRSRIAVSNRRRLLAVAGLSVFAVATLAMVVGGGSDRAPTVGADDEGARGVMPPSTEAFSPGPLADAATTPLATSAGNLRITDARLASQDCASAFEECRTASGSDRFVVFTLTEWEGRDVLVTDDFSRDASLSYVSFEGQRASFVSLTQQLAQTGSVRIAYEFLPTSAAKRIVRLAWPGSATLKIHLEG